MGAPAVAVRLPRHAVAVGEQEIYDVVHHGPGGAVLEHVAIGQEVELAKLAPESCDVQVQLAGLPLVLLILETETLLATVSGQGEGEKDGVAVLAGLGNRDRGQGEEVLRKHLFQFGHLLLNRFKLLHDYLLSRENLAVLGYVISSNAERHHQSQPNTIKEQLF